MNTIISTKENKINQLNGRIKELLSTQKSASSVSNPSGKERIENIKKDIETLENRKKEIDSKVLEFKANFEKENRRKMGKDDMGPLKPLAQENRDIKTKRDALEVELQELLKKAPEINAVVESGATLEDFYKEQNEEKEKEYLNQIEYLKEKEKTLLSQLSSYKEKESDLLKEIQEIKRRNTEQIKKIENLEKELKIGKGIFNISINCCSSK